MFDEERKGFLSKPFVYLVTDRNNQRRDHFLATIVQAVQGGIKMVQLREKTASYEEFCEIGIAVRTLLKAKKIPLIINDRIDVALAIQADGVHLGQSDAHVNKARELLGEHTIIGLSLNTLEDIEKTKELPIDYVAASPVFSSRTKKDCGSPFGINSLKKLCALSPYPVVGIGGIHLDNVDEVMSCGTMGVAVVSAIFDATCPKTAAQHLVRRLEHYTIEKNSLLVEIEE